MNIITTHIWNMLEYLPVGGNAVQLECHRFFFFNLWTLALHILILEPYN